MRKYSRFSCSVYIFIGPSEHNDICKLLQPLSQDQLQDLGLKLGLTIDRITGYGNVTKCQYMQNLVRDWTNKSDNVVDATWLSLEEALRESRHNGIADLVSKRTGSHQISGIYIHCYSCFGVIILILVVQRLCMHVL